MHSFCADKIASLNNSSTWLSIKSFYISFSQRRLLAIISIACRPYLNEQDFCFFVLFWIMLLYISFIINCLFWGRQSQYGNLGLDKFFFFFRFFFTNGLCILCVLPLIDTFWQVCLISTGPRIRPVAFLFLVCSSQEGSWKQYQEVSASNLYTICVKVMIPILNWDLNQNGKLNGRSRNVIDLCWEYCLREPVYY